MSLNFVAIDIETAAPQWDTICSIAMVRVVEGKIIDEYSTLINPECDFNPQYIRINGITPEMVAEAPTFGDVALEVLDFIESDVLVAHNVLFDANVLQRDLKRYGQPIPEIRTFCTMACARAYKPNLMNHRLPTLCAEYSVELKHHHSAMDDVRACALCMIAMANSMQADSLDDVLSILHIDYGMIAANRVVTPKSTGRQSLYGSQKDKSRPKDNPFLLLEDLKNGNPDISNEIEMSQLKDGRTIAFKCAESLLFYLTLGKVSSFVKTSSIPEIEKVSALASAYKDGSIKLPINASFDYPMFISLISKLAKERYEASLSSSFGCCNDFIRCSDELCCLKADNPDYKGCLYRKNLEAGNVFYGINKGITIEEFESLKKEKEQARALEKRKRRAGEKHETQPRSYVGRSIIQLTDDGTVVKTYATIAAAVKDTKISSKSIRDAANGVQKHAGGFCWKYADQC